MVSLNDQSVMLDSMAEAIRGQRTQGKISGWIGQEADDRLLRAYDRRHWPRTLQSNKGVYLRPEWDWNSGLITNTCEVLLPASDTAIGQYTRRGFRFQGWVHPDARPSDVIESYRKYAPTVLRESLDAYEERMRRAEVLRQQALLREQERVAAEALAAQAIPEVPVDLHQPIPEEPVPAPDVEMYYTPQPQTSGPAPRQMLDGSFETAQPVTAAPPPTDAPPDIDTLKAYLPPGYQRPSE